MKSNNYLGVFTRYTLYLFFHLRYGKKQKKVAVSIVNAKIKLPFEFILKDFLIFYLKLFTLLKAYFCITLETLKYSPVFKGAFESASSLVISWITSSLRKTLTASFI